MRDVSRRRLEDASDRAHEAIAERLPQLRDVEVHRSLTFVPGTRVVDLITGEEGEVYAAYTIDRIVPAAEPSIGGSSPGETR